MENFKRNYEKINFDCPTGVDPEGSKVFYSISGEYFKVDKNTGIVSTLKSFDREKEEIISVVISVTGEFREK